MVANRKENCPLKEERTEMENTAPVVNLHKWNVMSISLRYDAIIQTQKKFQRMLIYF